MKKTIKYVAPWLSIAAIGGAIALAPFANAAPAGVVPHNNVIAACGPFAERTRRTTLWLPNGTDPEIPFQNGYYNPILRTISAYVRTPVAGRSAAFPIARAPAVQSQVPVSLISPPFTLTLSPLHGKTRKGCAG